MSSNTQGFKEYDPTLFTKDYVSPTRENMPKYLRERFPLDQLLAVDVPPAIVLTVIVASNVYQGPGVKWLWFVILFVVFGFLSLPAPFLIPLQILGLATHKLQQREEIIEWCRRGWVRTGLEPTEEMVEKARQRNAKMRARYSRRRDRWRDVLR